MKVTYCGNENDLLYWDRGMDSVVPIDEMDSDEAREDNRALLNKTEEVQYLGSHNATSRVGSNVIHGTLHAGQICFCFE
jgi:hypothetical protein